MSRIFTPVVLTLGLSLAACAPMPSDPVPSRTLSSGTISPDPMPPRPMPPPSVVQCDHERARWAIGQAATAGVVERVRIDSRGRIARVIRPSDAESEHYIADRVSIRVNERNAIVGIACE